jgi:hypothetical protein
LRSELMDTFIDNTYGMFKVSPVASHGDIC